MTARVKRHSANTDRDRRPGRGFTLAEALIASVVLAVAALGVATTLSASSMQTQQADEWSTAQALARELLEEIISKSFTTQTNAGWSGGQTNRATYDDVKDYNGYTDNSTTGIKSLEGTALSLGDGVAYTRQAAVEYRATPGGASAGSGDFAMITVTVTSGSGNSVVLQRLRTNFVLSR